ncbi:hypothetical protein ACKWTF_015834 [Chironomus riparius]
MSIITNQFFSTVWHHMAKILCIVPYTTSLSQRVLALRAFFQYGFLNVVVVVMTKPNIIQFETIKSMKLNEIFITQAPDSNALFADKLKNMKGFQYKIIAYAQPGRVIINYQTIKSYMLSFLDIIKTAQNSTYHIIILHDYSLIDQYWLKRVMDLTINTAVVLDRREPKLLTYEIEGYCALVPILPKTTLFQIIFIRPFDELTWMFLALSIVSSVAVFYLFRGHGAADSPWLLGYGMFVYFIGQGVDFSRRNRPVLTILIQLIILMIFVLSNAYEGVITSFMI